MSDGQSFVFYDLETSGLSAQTDRIMQFAAIRTNLNLEPIGEPYNFLIKLSDDVLPSPGAIKVTGITPQKTIEEGYTEAEAARMISQEIFTSQTIVVGFNNVRFDDEFIRHLLWRNFYDPYEWSYKDGRSRWDILDVVRFTRAVRPGSINWPVDEFGKSTNRLELITRDNNLTHQKAHDALSDVEALISVAGLIKNSDTRLWDYLFKMRDKNLVKQLVNLDQPQMFVYASGKLESEFDKVTVAYPIAPSKNGNVIVFNLRYSPEELLGKSPVELAEFLTQKLEAAKLLTETDLSLSSADKVSARPIYFKDFKYNHCPAVAPVSVLRTEDYQRLGLDSKSLQRHVEILSGHPELIEAIKTLFLIKSDQFEQKIKAETRPVEARLYDGFLGDKDRALCQQIRSLSKSELKTFKPQFIDSRLPELYLNYKARSFRSCLTESEANKWEQIRYERLKQAMEPFVTELSLMAEANQTRDAYIVEELKLWLESILPTSGE